MTLQRLRTDILILGSGGAGPVRGAACSPLLLPDLRTITIATKGLARQVRLHPHGPGRLQCGADPQGRLRSSAISWTPLTGGKWLPHQELAWTLVETRAVERVRELENEIGCFFDRNPDGSAAWQGLCGPDFRPHRPQGRSHRHRDHQPADGAGVGAPGHRAPGGVSGARPDPGSCADGTLLAGVLFDRTFAPARCKLHRGQVAVLLATGGGPTMYRYHTPVGRQEHGRPRHGVARSACRCATWRWCSSTPRDCSPAPAPA